MCITENQNITFKNMPGIGLPGGEVQMIRLAATDLDDTILPEGTFDINPEYYEVIRELKKKGIMFAAASGRHSSSIRRLFECVKDDVIILAGNGSCVMHQGRTEIVNALDRDLYLEILDQMRLTGTEMILVDNPECVWTDSSREDLFSWVRDGYHVQLEKRSDLAQVQSPILKIAMYVEADAAKEAALFREKFEGRANIMAAGARWVDVVANGVDKGTGLKKLQSIFNISKEETAAFGDNGNDIGMLELAGESYAVENARQEVKEAAGHVIGPMDSDAVLKVLKDLL